MQKKKLKSIISCVMTLSILLSSNYCNTSFNTVYAAERIATVNNSLMDRVNGEIKDIGNYMKNGSTYSNDWKTVGLMKSGVVISQDYFKNYLKDTAKLIQDSKGYFFKITDYERIALGVTAAGGDATNIGGYNLIEKIYNFTDGAKEIDFQGINGVIFGLIALDSKDYKVPDNAKYTRENLIDYILENRNSDGGWDLNMSGDKSDVDITAMSLIALAPYHDYVSKSSIKAQDIINEAVNWLSSVQRKDGGFESAFSNNSSNSESCSQTIIALCANGIDPTSPKFTKDKNAVEALMKFKGTKTKGMYKHILTGENNGMATEQAFQALAAYKNFKEGKGSIYRFSNNNIDNHKESNESKNIKRLYGDNRLKTCRAIAESFSNEKLDNVVIASAYGYADALSGSVLAKKLNSPMLLVGNTIEESKDTLDYIEKHLNKSGHIYILGGKASVDNKFVDKFKNMGYEEVNIKRLGGKNREETCKLISKEMGVAKNTPVFIAANYGFADALSASGPAAIKGYPILLSGKNNIPQETKEVIKNIQPSKVYIAGGIGVLTNDIENEINNLCKNTTIVRLGGKDRYDTSYKINSEFKKDYSKVAVLAAGKDFPDALSGAPLAAKLNAALLLVDDNSFDKQKKLIDELNIENIILLGGKASISDMVERKLNY